MVQEPYVGASGELTQNRGYRVVQRYHKRTKPVKAAIVVLDNDLEVIEHPTLTTENIAVATLKTRSWEICVISIYFEDSLPIEPYLTHVKLIKETLKSKNLIIGGDANAWSTWWGSDSEDHRGEELMGAIEEMEMHILNEGTVPTFFTVRNGTEYKSRVDITACSRELLGAVSNWEVDEGVTSSDHNAITFSIMLNKGKTHRQTRTTRLYNTKKAKWNQFRLELRNQLEKHKINLEEIVKTETDIQLEEIVAKFTISITEASKQAIPIKKSKQKIDLPWWTSELENLKKDMRRKKCRIKCAAPRRKPHVVEQYLESKKTYILAANKAQVESWKDFCSTQDRESIWDGIYRVIRRTAKISEDQPLVKEGKVLSPEESTKLLAKTFFPEDFDTDDNDDHRYIREKAKDIDELLENDTFDPVFTENELKYVIETFNPKKAPGSDGFTSDICAEAINVNPQIYLAIANKCLELSCFPVIWKQAVVIVLRKPGKSDYSQAKSYRPIGLLPLLGKILEKMIVRRVRWHLLPKANPRQYGFVPQRSTEDSLYDLVQHLRKNIDDKLINVVVSLDIEGAFDGAWWPAVKCRLIDKKCPHNLRKILNSYLKERKVRVQYAGKECSVLTTKGCVQGSIAGPTLWNVLLDPLLEQMDGRKVHCQAFADDIVLVFSGDTMAAIEEKANQLLNCVYEWGVVNKLRFAPLKTHAMVMTKKLKYDTPHIRMGSTLIQVVDEIKILGLILDSKLTFNSHVKYICTKALNIYKPLARSAKIKWGLSAEIIRTMYVAIIEPIILYAANVWAPAAGKLSIQRHLNTVQRGFAQKMCKAYRTVSLNAATIISGTIPLHLRALEVRALYEAKSGRSQNILYDREAERKVCSLDAFHPARETIADFACLDDLSAETVEKNKIDGLSIFTDGSKMEGRVGAALSCWEGEIETRCSKFLLEHYCTVFQAELYALYKATEYALKSNKPSVNILSDSRSSLEIIKKPGTFHPLAFEIRKNLVRVKEKGHKIRLFWIKAHVGIEGNERADALAKAAGKKKIAPNYDKCPLSFIKKEIRNKTLEVWNQNYHNCETAALTKLFFPTVESAFSVVRKVHLTPIHVQIITGHGGFGQYLSRFKCKDSPACDCDPANEESVLHILTECSKYAKERFEAEQKTDCKIIKGSLSFLISNKHTRTAFLDFCTKVASKAILRNKTQ